MREKEEDKCKIEFQKLQSQREAIEKNIDMMIESYKKNTENNMYNNTTQYKIATNYLIALYKNIEQEKIKLQEKIKEVEIKRGELIQKQMDRKTVEILREKKLSEYLKEIEKQEQRSNDEFALYGFVRNIERR